MTTTSSSTTPTPFPQEGVSEPDQRVWALKAARQVIAVGSGPFGGTREISPIDLVSLSQYILSGVDPYAMDKPTAVSVSPQ